MSNFDNLEAVPPTVNCSITSLTKVDKNHEQFIEEAFLTVVFVIQFQLPKISNKMMIKSMF